MKIIIQGKPLAKMRPRHSTRSGYVVTYDPQAKDKELVKAEIRRQITELLNHEDKSISMEASNLASSKAFQVQWDFYLPIPESCSMAEKNAKLWGFDLPICKPDYDNLEKFYLDCANGLIWPDDRMIVRATANKHYGEPRMELIVNQVKEKHIDPRAQKILKMMSPSEIAKFADEAESLAYDLHYLVDMKEYLTDQEITNSMYDFRKFVLRYAPLFKKIEKVEEFDIERFSHGKTLS